MAKEFTDSEMDNLLAQESLIVIDFWAEWCGPCKHIAPIVDELATEYEGKVLIGKYDVDEGEDLPVDFSIRSIPTILFFKDGELKNRHVGSSTKEALAQKIEELING